MKTLFHILWATWVLAVSIACIVMGWALCEKKSFFQRYFRGRRRNKTIMQINDNFDRDLRDLLVQEEAVDKQRSMRNHPTATNNKKQPQLGDMSNLKAEAAKEIDRIKKRNKPRNDAWREDYYQRYLKNKRDRHDDLD